MLKTNLSICVITLLGARATAGPKPADGASGIWRSSYTDPDNAKQEVSIFLARHKTAVCGYYMTKDSNVANGTLSLVLKGTTATGLWRDNTGYGKTEVVLADGKLKGGWANGPEEPKLLPLIGDFAAPSGKLPGNLTGKYRYKQSNYACNMSLTHKGAAITMTSIDNDPECGTWSGTVTGGMIAGEWKTKDQTGHFQVLVSGSASSPWMMGTAGNDDKDTISCDDLGKIRLDKV